MSVGNRGPSTKPRSCIPRSLNSIGRCTGRLCPRSLVCEGLRLLDADVSNADELAECMVRRVNAREKFRMKESLRQCIRPLGGECSPGLDEIRRVPVL